MEKWKVYEKEYDVDGSEFWHVNGSSLNCNWYHTHLNVPPYYDSGSPYNWLGKWDIGSPAREDMTMADFALSILADYFEEKPTEEDAYSGQYKCWKYHWRFKRYLWIGYSTITSEHIAEWIANEDKQFQLEEELIKRLKDLSVPVSLSKAHAEYIWELLDHRGTSQTFPEAVEAALEYAMEKLLIYLEIFTETPDINRLL